MRENNSAKILKEIERIVNDQVTVIDALVHYAEEHDMEIELVAEIVKRSPVLKAKVQDDAERLNMMEKTARLPI